MSENESETPGVGGDPASEATPERSTGVDPQAIEVLRRNDLEGWTKPAPKRLLSRLRVIQGGRQTGNGTKSGWSVGSRWVGQLAVQNTRSVCACWWRFHR